MLELDDVVANRRVIRASKARITARLESVLDAVEVVAACGLASTNLSQFAEQIDNAV